MEPRHTIAVEVDNTPGVLSRVTGLFSGRGYNIESLCVAETMEPDVSRITLVSVGEPQIIEHSVEKMHIWLNEIARELGGEDRVYAYRALRAVLHTLRDRLTVDVAAKLAAQLPTLIRGVYYEDWDPSRTPSAVHDVDAFLARVAHEGDMAGETEASIAVAAVARVLRAHVSAGEIDGVLAVLPDSVRPLIAA